MKRNLAAAAAVLLLAGCGGGGGGGGPEGGGQARVRAGAALMLVAGMAPIPPGEAGAWADGVDLERLGIDPWTVDAYYDLTTPAGEPFQFDAVSRRPGNSGEVTLSLAHAADDGNTPVGGPETVAEVGIVPSASGAVDNAPWLDAHGDGFGRISLRGTVDADQVLAVRAVVGGETTTVLVRVGIGDESPINLAARTETDYPGVTDARDLYSSNSWMFGLPTAAVSGDRTTIVAYEGDRADPSRYARYEMRLQLDNLGGGVTGGASEEASADSGNWRDHEVAGLYNTLALVHSGVEDVTVRLSFDRGATFAQTKTLETGSNGWVPRLAQVAMAADYTLAVACWKSGRDEGGTTDLNLVLGRPSDFDGGGSPTRYAFDPAITVRRVAGDATPLLTGLAWSGGGDLVVGYGFSTFTSNPDRTWTSLTQNRCAVIPWEGDLRDTLVEEDEVVGKDPSVAVLGSGDAMRIFFAYEASDGVRLAVSGDAGRTFGPPRDTGDPSSSVPTVLARDQGGEARVDLLYMAQGAEGAEIHLVHWDDFDEGAPATYRLTTAKMVPSASTPRDRAVPGAAFGILPPDYGYRTTQVAWFGYDAVLDGDDVVLVYDEQTYDAMVFLGGGWFEGGRGWDVGLAAAPGAEFSPAEPPPLAPGLTEPVPAPDPDHMHQLKMLRLD